MNYFVIIVILLVCIITTIFLVKESYTSKKTSIIISIIASIIGILSTILSSYISNIYNKTFDNLIIDENNVDKDQTNISINGNINNNIIENSNDTIFTYDIFGSNYYSLDELNYFSLSKNYDDTKILDSETKFIFYNHFESKDDNVVTLSYFLDRKCNMFEGKIHISDNMDTPETFTSSIDIYLDESLAFSSDNLNNTSNDIYVSIVLTDASMLTFSINTKMIDSKEDISRTISLIDTKLSLK